MILGYQFDAKSFFIFIYKIAQGFTGQTAIVVNHGELWVEGERVVVIFERAWLYQELAK